MTDAEASQNPVFDGVAGQDAAVSLLLASARRPVHAYLFVGPSGTGKKLCARGFAAALLCPSTARTGIPDGTCEVCRRVLSGIHPDVLWVEREGPFISIDTAREVTRAAAMSPVEGTRKVVVLDDFHLVRDTGPALLKTVEEPPETTVFVILAEHVPPELETIASRCLRVDFSALSTDQVTAALIEAGSDPEVAAKLAAASGGSLERARLLAVDEEFERRRRSWLDVVARLDGTGATAAAIADELVALLDSSVAQLRDRQTSEAEAVVERNRRYAEVIGGSSPSGGGRGRRASAVRGARGGQAGVPKELEDRHRREQRRQRTDELRFGLATIAGAYMDRVSTAADPRRRSAAMQAIAAIDTTARSLEFNPGELLALQALLARLGRISTQA